MIVLILSILTFLSLFYSCGSLLSLLKVKLNEGEKLLTGIPITFFVLSTLNFFTALNFQVCIYLCLTTVIFSLIKVKWKRTFKVLKTTFYNYPLLTIGYLIFALLNGVCSIEHSDSGLYHISGIKWITDYPVIKGIGNIHGRLATHSSVWVLNAFSKTLYNLTSLNVVIILILGFFLLKEKQKDNNTHLILLTSPFFMWRMISSPSTDFFLICYTSLLIFFFFRKKKINFLTIMVLTIFSITIKLSILFLFPMFALILYTKYRTEGLKRWLICSLSFLLIVPFFIKTIYVSGYLLYPFSMIDIFNVPWKIEKDCVEYMDFIVSNFAKTKNAIKHESISGYNWVNYWWNNHLTVDSNGMNHFGNQTLLLTTIILGLSSLVIVIFKKNFVFVGYVITATLAIVVWFHKAPDFRFGYLFFLNLIFISISVIRYKHKKLIVKSIVTILLLKMVFIQTIYHKTGVVAFFDQIICPQNLIASERKYKTEYSKGGVKLYLPLPKYQIWDIPLPSAIHSDNQGVGQCRELHYLNPKLGFLGGFKP